MLFTACHMQAMWSSQLQVSIHHSIWLHEFWNLHSVCKVLHTGLPDGMSTPAGASDRFEKRQEPQLGTWPRGGQGHIWNAACCPCCFFCAMLVSLLALEVSTWQASLLHIRALSWSWVVKVYLKHLCTQLEALEDLDCVELEDSFCVSNMFCANVLPQSQMCHAEKSVKPDSQSSSEASRDAGIIRHKQLGLSLQGQGCAAAEPHQASYHETAAPSAGDASASFR